MGIAGFAGAGLAGEDGGEGASGRAACLGAAGFFGGATGGEALKRGLDGGQIVEGVEAVGAAAEFSRSLGAAKHEEAEDGGLVTAEVENGADSMLVFGDAGVADSGDQGEIFKGVEGLANLLLGKIEDGIATGALVARVDQGVEREWIVLRRGYLFFDEGAEDTELVSRELHDFRVPQVSGLRCWTIMRSPMSTDKLLFLSEDQVRNLLTYDGLIPAIRQALMDFSAGLVVQPLRTVIPVAAHSGWFAVMPAVYGGVMGAKMVTFYPGNVSLEKHTHTAMIQLFRTDTGEPLAAMDGRLITEMRTAAVSAVAVDLLARPEVKVLGILGSGVQARSHVQALTRVRKFEEIRVWSRTEKNARRFAGEVGARVTSAEEAVRDADVVLTLTSSPVPILKGRWLKNDAVVCAVGVATPDRRELDDEAMRGAVVVESREAATKEAGEIVLAKAEVSAEIGELLGGAVIDRKGLPVVFKSVGIAIEDIAAAKLVYELVTGSRKDLTLAK
jgi:ornithine cyclodeaminase/alanine dehydrogenase-like protein (mu-crystallin family)